MLVYLGADHKGFALKQQIKASLKSSGYQVIDLGNDRLDENDDYPDFATLVAQKVSIDYENSKGILICGSGVGMDMVANKFSKVRSVLASTPNQAFDSRNDDDTNVLALGANYLTIEDAKKIINVWLQTSFSREEKHLRRLQKISELEVKTLRILNETTE